MPVCPMCQSTQIKKNGFIATGKQNHRCLTCGRQFVENPKNKIISEQTWNLVDKLLLERIPIAGISRVTGISEPWLQKYINEKYDNLDKKIPESVINNKKKFKLKSNVMKCGHS